MRWQRDVEGVGRLQAEGVPLLRAVLEFSRFFSFLQALPFLFCSFLIVSVKLSSEQLVFPAFLFVTREGLNGALHKESEGALK